MPAPPISMPNVLMDPTLLSGANVEGIAMKGRLPGIAMPPGRRGVRIGGGGGQIATTPEMAGAPIQDTPGGDASIGADERYKSDLEGYRGALEKGLPQATGLRGVLGKILTYGAPFVAGPMAAQLGQRVLYPGMDQYQSDIERRKAILDADQKAAQLQSLQEERKSLQENRLASAEARKQSMQQAKQGQYERTVTGIEGKGGYEVGGDVPSMMPSLPGQSPSMAPQTVEGPDNLPSFSSLGGRPSETQADPVSGLPLPSIGSIRRVETPEGEQESFAIPRPNIVAKRKLESEQEKLKGDLALKRADKDIEREASRVEVPLEVAKDAGRPEMAGQKVSEGVLLNLMTSARQQNKPEVEKEYTDFKAGYLERHPSASLDEVVKAYADAKRAPEKPPQSLMMIPTEGGGYRATLVSPGAEVAPGALTASGVSTMNTPTSQSRAMAEMAKTIMPATEDLVSQVNHLKEKVGPGKGRWNQLWVNRVGMNDPEFAGLDTDLDLFASALVRTHFGARGGQGYREELRKQFSQAQTPEDLISRIEHANDWIVGYAKMAGDKSIKSALPSTTSKVPSKGESKIKIISVEPLK